MLSNYFTLMIIPNKNGKVFRLRLSSGATKVLTFVATVLLLATLVMLIDYSYTLGSYQDQKDLEKRIHFQQFRVHEAHQEIVELAKNLEQLSKFDQKLCIISGQTECNLEPFPRRTELANLVELQKSEYNLIEDINLLNQDSQARLVNLFMLDAYLTDQSDRLQRTPSIAPTKGHLSSGFGYRSDPFTKRKKLHKGIDYSNIRFTPIYSPANGVVTNTFNNGAYGKFLVIDHGYGVITRYAHLEKYEVVVGQRVKRGQLIARMGNTGRSTATHLHYEVVVQEQHINPLEYVLDAN